MQFFKIRHPRKCIPSKTHQEFSILKRFSFLLFFNFSKDIRRFSPQLITISPRKFGDYCNYHRNWLKYVVCYQEKVFFRYPAKVNSRKIRKFCGRAKPRNFLPAKVSSFRVTCMSYMIYTHALENISKYWFNVWIISRYSNLIVVVHIWKEFLLIWCIILLKQRLLLKTGYFILIKSLYRFVICLGC